MSYLDNFEHSFMKHTLAIIREYKGSYDATILVNCLLGLLVIPKERSLSVIPLDPLSDLAKWGIDPNSIEDAGRITNANPYPETLRGLVYNLRNAVAHFNITPVPHTADVHSFRFTARNGLKATIKLHEMREFVERLAAHLDSR